MSRLVFALAAIALVCWLCRESPRVARASAWSAPAHGATSGSTWSFGAASEPVDGGVWNAGDGATPDPTLSDRVGREIRARLCPAAARTLCDARTRAGCSLAVPWIDPTDVAHGQPCTEYVESLCASWAARRYELLDARLVLNEASLQACIASIDEGATRSTPGMDASCDDLVSDPAMEGEACDFPWFSCGTSGRCLGGRCQPNARRGEPCLDDPCGRDLVCVAGLCEPPTPSGAACDDDSICASRFEACIDGVCASHVSDGSECTYDSECGIARRCFDGRCTPVPSTTCSLDGDCGQGRRCEGELQPTCERPTTRGRACIGPSDCGPLTCVDGTCEGLEGPRANGTIGEGDPCPGSSTDCRPGLVCGYELDFGFACMTPLAIGERCGDARPCAPDSICVWRGHGTCGPEICGVADYFVEIGED